MIRTKKHMGESVCVPKKYEDLSWEMAGSTRSGGAHRLVVALAVG